VRRDVLASLGPSPLDLHAYAAEILARFRNPAIGHKLAQIAWDGSQKLPYRLLDTIAEALDAGRPVARLAVPVAAWIAFLARQARAGVEIVDPLAGTLAEDGAPIRLRRCWRCGRSSRPVSQATITFAMPSVRRGRGSRIRAPGRC
jgi:fructuronate reductase